MQIYNGPILTLEHARLAQRNLKLTCRCGHEKYCGPWTIESNGGLGLTLAEVARRARCGRCGRQGCEIAYSQNVLEQWSDAVAMAKHIKEQERQRAIIAYGLETRALEESYRRAGWV